MKRYFISDIRKDDPDEWELGYHAAVIRQFGTNPDGSPTIPSHAAIMPPSNPDGSPSLPWCLVIVDRPNMAPAIGRPGIIDLPDVGMDVKVSAVHRPTVVALKGRLTARGINSDFIDAADGFREVVRVLGQRLQASFNENGLDVG